MVNNPEVMLFWTSWSLSTKRGLRKLRVKAARPSEQSTVRTVLAFFESFFRHRHRLGLVLWIANVTGFVKALHTRLSQFDFRSKLKTWAYRIAVNYILDVKKSPVEKLRLSFGYFAERLSNVPQDEGASEIEESLLVEEVKLACTFGMLQCLDRPNRLAYLLGEIWEIPGPEAAAVLEISPDLFRKRLQTSRAAILDFTRHYCGLASDAAKCRCSRQVPIAVGSGRVQPDRLRFVLDHHLSSTPVRWCVKSTRPTGRWKCIGLTILVQRPSTSLENSWRRWMSSGLANGPRIYFSHSSSHQIHPRFGRVPRTVRSFREYRRRQYRISRDSSHEEFLEWCSLRLLSRRHG